jgi:hypothetical protein
MKCFEVIGDAITRKGGKSMVLELDDIIHQNKEDTPIYAAKAIHSIAKDKMILKDLAKTGHMIDYLKEMAQRRKLEKDSNNGN